MGHVAFTCCELLAPYLSVPTSNKDRCVALSSIFTIVGWSTNIAILRLIVTIRGRFVVNARFFRQKKVPLKYWNDWNDGSFILDTVIMWVNSTQLDSLRLPLAVDLVIGGIEEPWQIQQPRRWRFWLWRFNVPATIPSLSLETPVGGEAGGGCFVGFCSSRRVIKLSNKKKWGGQFFREEVEQVQYTKKKRENWKMIWKLGWGYISYPGGLHVWRYLVCSVATWKGTLGVRLPNCLRLAMEKYIQVC